MTRARLGRMLVLLAIGVAVTVSVGGGGTYLALELTTRPQFCRTCHYMEPYVDSWATSSHKDVSCVECHYEPGLLETFEGKFKALTQLAKYVTGTEGPKPWAEVSDYSCMRSGCHSQRLLEGEIRFGRIRFDHRHHLVGMRRGKELRCTSCHSQIVQGEHLTVTTSSCILCHFKPGAAEAGSRRIDSCDTCHGPPPGEIQLGSFVFRHGDYLERGVSCDACHGDITRGTGEVPRERCGSCHNKQAHLDRYDEADFLHRKHVTDHSVSCLECHMEIRHGLPPREEHFRGDCTKCHTGSHDASADLYRGTGGRNVKDNPGVMYLARVTCNGCHRPPFPGAPAPPRGATFKADPLACLDCHGPGFEGMDARWQAEVKETLKRAEEALAELREMAKEEWPDGDVPKALRHADDAAFNIGLVHLDKSMGVHNLPYARDLLRRAAEDLKAGYAALDPGESPGPIPVGPRTPSAQGCTTLCHVGVEGVKVAQARDLPFDHARHFGKARLDCAKCHLQEPHGATVLKQADCVKCHHKQEEAIACRACHSDQAWLRKARPEGAGKIAMEDLDCLGCHETLAEGHSREAVAEVCESCHDSDPEDSLQRDFPRWLTAAAAPLEAVERKLAGAPAGAAADGVRAALARLRRAGPHHNPEFVRREAARLLGLLDGE